LAGGWHPCTPASIAEGVARTVCAVAYPPKEEPIEADLRKGSWTDLGASADGRFRLQVRIDGIVKLKDGHAQLRPIAGTRPRSDDAAQDAAHECELRADPKENAEHVMLVDLARNDLGRGLGRVRPHPHVEWPS